MASATRTRRRSLAALTLAAGLLLPAACTDAEPVDVEYEASDVHDCDAEDRRKKEIPDCGRKVGGKYQEWSWVKAGKTRPPAGWSPKSESSTAGKPAPKATTKKSTRTDGGSKSGTSRTGPSGRRR